jgi:hypothetical protein
MALPVISLATGHVTWVDPLTNTDTSPVTAGEITGFNAGFRDINAAGSVAGAYPITAGIAPSATSVALSTIAGLVGGKQYAVAVQAATANGVSAWSTPEFEFQAAVPLPNPPTAVSVS